MSVEMGWLETFRELVLRGSKAMLQFEGKWRYDSPGQAGSDVVSAFRELIDRISGQSSRKRILEHFKHYFASSAGGTSYPSSDVGWASTDLDEWMDSASKNAPLFIEAFHCACEELERSDPDIEMPGVGRINRILTKFDAGFQIDPPRLVATQKPVSIEEPDDVPSLDAQAKKAIEDALEESERLLSEGNARQAVQEALWLLETFSTAFRSESVHEGSIQGRYFNKIVEELHRQGESHQKQILKWMTSLHGYLSSPTGGGVRHGVDLKKGRALRIAQARLYCNLIRSYLTFLIAEHERLQS